MCDYNGVDRFRSQARTALLFVAVCVLCGCAGEPETPEARVRAALAAIEEAAERRDAGAMKAYVSEGYADAHGNDRRAIAAIVTGHFLRNRSVHLLVQEQTLEIRADGRAAVALLVAMAGVPIPSPAALAGLRADVYRFELELAAEEGAYRVVGASWRRASLDDFR